MIRYVTGDDIEDVLAMMELVKDDFAGYMEKEFLEALHTGIEKKEAILMQQDGKLAGMVSFSHAEKELTFLAVQSDYRKQGVAKQLVTKVAECFPAGEILSVITFQEGDPKGIPARRCYHACGFVDDEKLIIDEYPCQKMVLKV